MIIKDALQYITRGQIERDKPLQRKLSHLADVAMAELTGEFLDGSLPVEDYFTAINRHLLISRCTGKSEFRTDREANWLFHHFDSDELGS